jgi:hypothetical protein
MEGQTRGPNYKRNQDLCKEAAHKKKERANAAGTVRALAHSVAQLGRYHILDPEFIQGSSSQPMEGGRPVMTNRANDLMAQIDAMTIEEEQHLYDVDDDLSWEKGVTTRYGLLHYANLIRRTGPYYFPLQPT